MGQSHDGGDGHPAGPPTQSPVAVRGPGEPLPLRSTVLHARAGQREALRGEQRLRSAAGLGHARAPGAGPGRVECLPAVVRLGQAGARDGRPNTDGRPAVRTGPAGGAGPTGAGLRSVRTPDGEGRQVPDGAVQDEPLQRASALGLRDRNDQGLCGSDRGRRRLRRHCPP